MNKYFKYVLLCFILFLIIKNNVFANNENSNTKTINTVIQNKDKVIFPLTKDNFELAKSKIETLFNVSCEWDVKFICKKGWYNSINTYWCWLERTWKSLWKSFNTTCKMDPIEWIKQWNWVVIKAKVNSYYKDYPKELDISNNFLYKRLQKKELSCEASATADILSTIKGYNITEKEIIEKLPKSDFYNKTSYFSWWNRIWWDPELWFVWYIDKYNWHGALQYEYEWYGVYEKPIQKIYLDYWINTEIINNTMYEGLDINEYIHLRQLLIALNDWKYVQLWWDTCTYEWFEDWNKRHLTQELADKWFNGINYCVFPKKERIISWNIVDQDWTLRKINWLNWEHAFYLLWYKWWVEDPTDIIVWDTSTWKHTYSITEWLRKWRKVENRSLITK